MYVTIELVDLSCGHCDMLFAVPRYFDQRGRETGGALWCPAGHMMHYGERLIDKLVAEKARLTARLDQELARSKTLERSRAAVQGQLTKERKRTANGVCPCCHRSFVQLARHMKTKHPDFAGGDHGG